MKRKIGHRGTQTETIRAMPIVRATTAVQQFACIEQNKNFVKQYSRPGVHSRQLPQ
jgi:hypothetical protein